MIKILLSLLVISSAYADWDLESKEVFIKATKNFYEVNNNKIRLKNGFSQKGFERSYIKELKKYADKKLSHNREFKFKSLTVKIYASEKNSLSSFDDKCSDYKNINDCLYGNYDPLIFVVKTKKGKLYSIGHSMILPHEVNRFGNDGVEQEILIFKGKDKFLAKQANW